MQKLLQNPLICSIQKSTLDMVEGHQRLIIKPGLPFDGTLQPSQAVAVTRLRYYFSLKDLLAQPILTGTSEARGADRVHGDARAWSDFGHYQVPSSNLGPGISPTHH